MTVATTLYVPTSTVVFAPLKVRSTKAYILGSRVGVELSTLTVSRRVHPNISGTVDISITAGTGEYRINGGAWKATADVISDGDYFEARLTSSGDYETNLTLTFAIDAGSDVFTVTTMADPTTYIMDGVDFIVDGVDNITDGV